ncbi:hypothetical protein [Streptomyces sp. NPDC005953]|uniref:hypothetical protein n=1 Tax=Streptomyces sp. NPDC005953 TaxID=3156719 RepID=UPI0033F41F62
MNRLVFDAAERVLWTGAQASLGVLVTDLTGLPMWWAAPVALALATGKSWVAGRLGRLGTASTLPASKDPATPSTTYGP